ncbi:Ger(x)C family spore germination protein [Lysinibacillus sphaericus]|uniref:Spore germination protein KC n=1 Tax=Lysinibacillus sphaericus OT4b.31 TaxID=1285586 RepID=R7Z8M3_LYSSH|nr:Ger(x)C family spore germination protein [Lysinibacillus sphaericus]EON70296.1 spore germination protein KC [Lysinibacillus sphaericus OT4b.31]
MKKFLILFLLISLSFLLSSCWGKRELNELAIVVAVGVDKIDDGYEVSVQIVNPSEVSSTKPSSGQSPVITYSAKGASVFEAVRKMTTITPRKAYFAHLQVLVIGETLATEGINQTLDLLSRDQEIRNNFDVIVSHQASAKDVLNVLTAIEKIPANKIISSLSGSEKAWGSTLSVTVDDLTNALNRIGKSTVLPAIEIQGDKQLGIDKTNVERIKTPVILKYVGLVVLKQDKIIGLLTEEESRSFNFLNNKIKSTVEIISCPKEGKLTTEITKSTAKMTGKFDNGTPKIEIGITIDQNVGEVRCNINLNNNIEYINKKTAELIKARIEQTLKTIQKSYQLDILGFGEVLYREDHKAWKKIKDEWPTIFPDIAVNVDVKVNTSGLGTMSNSLLKHD